MKAVPSHLGIETDKADTAPEIAADPVFLPSPAQDTRGRLSLLPSCHWCQSNAIDGRTLSHTHSRCFSGYHPERNPTADCHVGTARSSCCSITEVSRCVWREQAPHLERTLAGVDARHGDRLIFHLPRSPDSHWVLVTSAEQGMWSSVPRRVTSPPPSRFPQESLTLTEE